MLDSPYSFTVEVRRAGALLAAASASAVACAEDAYFKAVVAGRLPNDGTLPVFTGVPVWAETGPPTVAGLTLVAAGTPAATYGLEVFVPKVRALIRNLLARKVLQVDDRVEWSVLGVEEPPAPPSRFRARACRAPYPFRDGRLPAAAPGTLGVSVARDVLEAIRQQVVRSPTTECAGLLVGRLIRDPERGAAQVIVSDEVPTPPGARGASSTHFAFGPESFRVARDALARAGNGDVAVGWWHSHPQCENCPQRSTCTAETVFFSSDDVQVHASAFPAAYMIALVAGKLRDRKALDPGFRLYGWKGGSIAERSLQLTDTGADTGVSHACRQPVG
jgi:proteasome lid subunit RPN8/RPN11